MPIDRNGENALTVEFSSRTSGLRISSNYRRKKCVDKIFDLRAGVSSKYTRASLRISAVDGLSL